MKALYRICGHHALLPRSLQIQLSSDCLDSPQRYGGFSEVWKGRYEGVEIAAKALRVDGTSHSREITHVNHQHLYSNARRQTHHDVEVLQGSLNVENPLSSKRAPAPGSHDGGQPIYDGVGVDDKWRYQQVCQGA